MKQSLRIAVADDEVDMREYLGKTLTLMGHRIVVTASTAEELVARCRIEKPDLIITDIKMPGMDGIEAARRIFSDRPVPIILVSGYHEAELIERAEASHVLAYLVKPVKPSDLEPTMALTVSRFEQFQALQHEAVDLRQALADRKIIELSKQAIMKRAALDEGQAFRRLQKVATDRRCKLAEAARWVLAAEEDAVN